MVGQEDTTLMTISQPPIQLPLAFPDAPRGEALRSPLEGAEMFTAGRAADSLAEPTSLMEEVAEHLKDFGLHRDHLPDAA